MIEVLQLKIKQNRIILTALLVLQYSLPHDMAISDHFFFFFFRSQLKIVQTQYNNS